MAGRLPGWFGIEVLDIAPGLVHARLDLRAEFLAPNNFLHAGTLVTLADTCCGMGCLVSLPDGVAGFTTSELKTNFLRTAGEDEALRCEATLAHGGRTTQVWDALVKRESDARNMALFRCTQFLLPAEDPRTERQARMRSPRSPAD